MKKAIRSIFIIQIIILTIIGMVVYFKYRYISLFYKNISYLNVCVSDQKAFDAFLSWTEERGITVSEIMISPENEIVLHISDRALHNDLVISEGRIPERGEFVSDMMTGETNQSGIIKRLLPDYHFKIYGLYEPGRLNFTSLYAITLTSENEINEMIEEPALEGVTIHLNGIWDDNDVLVLLSSFSSMHIILVSIFLCSSTLVMFAALAQFVVRQSKLINRYISFGYSRLWIIFSIISDVFFEKNWLGIIGGLYVILSIVFLCSDLYRPFYAQAAMICLFFVIVFSCIYTIFLSLILLVYLIIRTNKTSLTSEGRKSGIIVQTANYCVKSLSVLLLFISVAFLTAVYTQFTTEKHNLQGLAGVENLYKVSMNDVGQETDLSIEVALHKKVADLYQHLTAENSAFFMDADDIYAMEVFGMDYPLTGLVTNGYATHITVSPNYFQFNPIMTSEGIPVEQEFIYSENVLNLLVPESLSSIYDELNEQFLDYFDFYRFGVYEKIYSDASNDLWYQTEQNNLEINIIPVKNGQLYFTFSPDIRQDAGNKILDPVVVVYTDNFHPSSTFTKASRCLYFQYDDNQKITPDDYLAEIVGIDGFLFAGSVWKDAAGRVSQLQRNYVAVVLLAIFIIGGYLLTGFNLFTNFFYKNQYAVNIKTMRVLSVCKRYGSAFIIVVTPTLLALFAFVLITRTRLARLFPIFSIREMILVCALLIGMDILCFICMERSLRKNQ